MAVPPIPPTPFTAAGISAAGGALARAGRLTSRLAMAVGDSRTAQGNFTNGTGSLDVRGFQYWTTLLTNGRVRFPAAYNFGVSGDTTTLILARMGPILACPATLATVYAGTNDLAGGVSATTIATNLTSITGQLLEAGKTVILINEQPRTISMTTAMQEQLYQLRRLIAAMHAPASGLYVVDPWALLADQTQTTASPVASYFLDGLHQIAEGARRIALKISDVINAIYTETSFVLPNINGDQYTATNTSGNLVVNPMMTGTGGTVGTGLTGTVADSWSTTRSANASPWTITASKTTDSNGFPWQQIAISGTATSSGPNVTLDQQLSGTKWSGGDILSLVGEISVDAGTSTIISAQLQLSVTSTVAGTVNYIAGGSGVTASLTPSAYSGTVIAPRVTLPADTTAVLVRFQINGDINAAAAITARLRNVGVYKVSSAI